jgi:phosphoglycerate-specific signal transduction histidine kinase
VEARKNKEAVIYSGFVAQDVEKAARALNYNFSGVDAAKSGKDLYGLRYAEFVVPLVKAVQELSKQNDNLAQTNDQLKARINEQEKINAGLQNQIDEIRLMISSTNAVAAAMPATTTLAQNIPNPFSNATVINYTLPQTFSAAKIIISDKSGKPLKEIHITSKGKGSIKVEGDLLAAGAYNYSLYIDGKLSGTKQMIVAK